MRKGKKNLVEPKEEKSFSVVEEAENIVKKLCEKYPDILWAVEPNKVGVYGCENQERPASSDTLAKIRKVSGVLKAVLEKHNIALKYIIELYWDDWNSWSITTKQWILFHELLHILDPDAKGLRKHNVEDFSITVDVVGVDGYTQSKLPDLLGDKKVEFRKDLISKIIKSEEKDDTPEPPDA